MRLRLATGPKRLFAAAFVIALIVFLPMRLVLGWIGLGEAGLTARAVSGSVWRGSLSEARFGDLAVGDVAVRLSPVHLLVGQARVALDGRDDARPLHGAIGVSRHGIALDDMTASLAAGTVFAPVPVTGIDLQDVSVRFQDGSCARAAGRVRATLSGEVGGIPLSQGMSGTATCEAGALLLPLVSQAGTEAATIRLWQTGRFRAELSLRPSDPAAGARLVLRGFRPTPAGYALAIEGSF